MQREEKARCVHLFLQEYMRTHRLTELSAVPAAALLDKAGILRDGNPAGLPLRKMLRAELIPDAYQLSNHQWRIPLRNATPLLPRVHPHPKVNSTALSEWSAISPVTSVSLPDKPGIYRLYLAKNADMTGTVLADLLQGAVLYIGKAEESLNHRDLHQHFTSGRTGSSTVRRSLGAVLYERLALQARPRSIEEARCSERAFRNYCFDEKGEERLTEWMHKYLCISWFICKSGQEARALEPGLIEESASALNIDRNPHGIYREKIDALRCSCREYAHRWFNEYENREC